MQLDIKIIKHFKLYAITYKKSKLNEIISDKV